MADSDGLDSLPAQDFEKSLKELEAIAKRMESGTTTLEESLQDFEKGIKLARLCQEQLKAAELRVRELIKTDDDFEKRPFELEDGQP